MKAIAIWIWAVLAVWAQDVQAGWQAMTPVVVTEDDHVSIRQTMTPLAGTDCFLVELDIEMEESLAFAAFESEEAQAFTLESPMVHCGEPSALDQQEALAMLGVLRFVLCEEVTLKEVSAPYLRRQDDRHLYWDVAKQMRQEGNSHVQTTFVVEVRAPKKRYRFEEGNIVQLQSTFVYAKGIQAGILEMKRLDLSAPKVRFGKVQ